VRLFSRPYIEKAHLARGTGQSQAEVLADSYGISIIDNFWIQSSGKQVTWPEILAKRDTSRELLAVSLDCEISADHLDKSALSGFTSIFTVKGTFPKAIYLNKLYKKGCNAEFEAVAWELGSALGIDTAEARCLGDGLVECDLFTNPGVSMAHADDVLDSGWRSYSDSPREALYAKLLELQMGSFLRQFERILILSYLTTNFDMHEENFGLLYDPKTFEFTGMAPAFDFNDAFQDWGNPALFHAWEMANLKEWASRHQDIVVRVPAGIDAIGKTRYLGDGQKKACVDRLNFLAGLQG
jgi:hypothetical protein